jgi:hypothetical protein
METPTPVDVNRLKNILGNAKKVMKAVEEKSPTKSKNRMDEGYGGYDNYAPQTPYYNEMDEREPVYENYIPQTEAQVEVRDYTAEDVMRSKMPDNVKQAMLNKPIPKLSYGAVTSSFGLEGLEDLIEKPIRRQGAPAPQRGPIRESVNHNSTEQMVTISMSQLNEMIDNRVNKILAEMFTKTVSEQTIKKTINTLIKEGKITTKK